MSTSLSDFAGLVRRFPLGVAGTFIIVVCGIASWFIHGQIANLEIVHQDRTREGEAMLTLLVGGSTLRQELAAAREATHRIEENLVIETNLAENAWYFYKIEEQTKARLSALHPLNSPPTDKSPLYKRIPYTLRVSGGYEETAAFLLALESGPRLASITSFSYARSAEGLALDLSLELLGKR